MHDSYSLTSPTSIVCVTTLYIVYSYPLSAHQQPQCEKTDEVEDSVIRALSKLLLRLNQNQNMAIFLAIRSWANKGSPTKLITFFRLFICCFFCQYTLAQIRLEFDNLNPKGI